MSNWIISGFLCFVASLALSDAAYSSEVDANIFVQQSSEKLFKLYDELVDSFYLEMDTTEDLDPIEAIKKLTMLIVEVKEISDISKDAQKFDLKTIQDPELKRALEKLKREANILVLEEDFFALMLKNLISLDDIAMEKVIPIFEENPTPNMVESEPNKIAFEPDVSNIFMNSKNSKEMEYYWTTWKNISAQWASDHFPDMLAAYKKAASLLGISALEFWYNFYGDETFLNKMENVMTQIKPLYQQLHAYIRSQLNEKYGNDVVAPSGPIPAHLIQQVILQTWTDKSVIDFPFKNTKMPNYDQMLERKSINNGKKLLDIAERFYQSLGFSPLSNEFWENRLKEMSGPRSDTDDCIPETIAETPKTYMKYCNEVSFNQLLLDHREMGKLHYADEMQNLPAYYFNPSMLSHSIGQAVMLSASTPKHLKAIGLLSDIKSPNELHSNRIFQLGLHTLLAIPTYFVESKLMHLLLNGSITMENINKHYWQLMDEYAGIEPPVDRPKSALDMPNDFYNIFEEENRQTRDFVSEILGYQFYEAICKKSGQVKDLQNCDFYGSKDAGKSLKKMMRLGISQPLESTISVVLPESSKLNAESLLNYFSPLHSFLVSKNKEGKAKIGWSSSQRRVD